MGVQFNVHGIFSDKNVTTDNSAIRIVANGDTTAFGLALNGSLQMKDSFGEVQSEYVGSAGTSYAIATGSASFDLKAPEDRIEANATNADGIAFVANTGEAGSDLRPYDPSYEAKLITGDFEIASPEKSAVSIASIPGTIHDYMYVESIYDTQDTSKPASSVKLTAGCVPIDNAEVTLSYKSTTYTGKAQKPGVTVKLDGKTLIKNTDYKVTYSNNVNVGKATVTIKGAGAYKGTLNSTFRITKAANRISKITPSSKTLKYSAVKKQSQSFRIKAKDKFGAKMTYSMNSKTSAAARKYITISKAGKVTVKKGTPKKTYTVKVKVSAAGTKNYNAKTATKNLKIVIK